MVITMPKVNLIQFGLILIKDFHFNKIIILITTRKI